MATLTELETSWTFDDGMRALAYLDAQNDIKYYYNQKQEREMQQKSKG